MEQVKKILANCAQDLTEEEKYQARQNIGVQNYQAGANISLSGNTISVTGLATVAETGNYYDLNNAPDGTEINVEGYIEPKPDRLTFGTSGEVTALMDGTTQDTLGILPVMPTIGDNGMVLTATNNNGQMTTSWQPSGGDGRLMRNDAELYLHHTVDSFKEYHVRNVRNNCLNHVAVENLQGQICSLLIEAPALESNEEYNYTVQFDCVNSSGGCNVTVENAAPKIITTYGVDSTSMWLRITGASTASDAINKEIRVVETVTPNSQIIKDGDGNNTSVVYSVGQTNKWLRITNAAYYGSTEYSTLAGPLVVTDVTGTQNNTTDRSVDFDGSPVCQVRVHGNVWEMVRF